jgi:hypothetical protein
MSKIERENVKFTQYFLQLGRIVPLAPVVHVQNMIVVPMIVMCLAEGCGQDDGSLQRDDDCVAVSQ